MPTLDEFGVAPKTTATIRMKRCELTSVTRGAVRVAAALGGALREAKRACRYGDWCEYLKATYEGSAREAQRYMKLAKAHPDPDAIPQDMSLREALAALTRAKKDDAPEPATHERISAETLEKACPAVDAAVEQIETLTALLLEDGLTEKHQAMRLAKKASEALFALEQFLYRDRVKHLREEKAALEG